MSVFYQQQKNEQLKDSEDNEKNDSRSPNKNPNQFRVTSSYYLLLLGIIIRIVYFYIELWSTHEDCWQTCSMVKHVAYKFCVHNFFFSINKTVSKIGP